MSYGFILLAAGNSSRLGQPKALLPYKDSTLIGHVLEQMRLCAPWPIVLVTGAVAIDVLDVITAHNAQWQEGMASSIRCGLSALLRASKVDNVIMAVCDQPAVSSVHFKALAVAKETNGSGIVASSYAGVYGTPVLFDKKYFPEMLQLNGKAGAKSLLENHPSDVTAVALAGGEVDIDTLENYRNLA